MFNLIILIISYLLGSISGSIIVSSVFFKEDIRIKGSGNAGTTNTFRVYGKRYAIIAFLIDIIKGVLAPLFASLFNTEYGIYIASVAVVVGHCWPIFYNFKGGKGVATNSGVNVFFSPLIAFLQLIIFIVINITTGLVSLSSLIMTISSIILFMIFNKINYALLTVLIINALIIFIKHKENIVKLIKGKENITNLVKGMIDKHK